MLVASIKSLAPIGHRAKFVLVSGWHLAGV